MLILDLEFPHAYEIEEVPELPGTGKYNIPVFYFPRTKPGREHDGLWLKVSAANGTSWIGCFVFAYNSQLSLSKIASTPDPDRICVVSKGGAHIVKADDPDVWEQLPLMPVTELRSIPDHQLLVFADFTRLIAYGRNGVAWQSPRLCWDELRITKITSMTIEGTGYDPTNSLTHASLFSVDIKTGNSLFPSPISKGGSLSGDSVYEH